MAEHDDYDGELSQQLYVGDDSDRLLDKPKDRSARCDDFAFASNSESSEQVNLNDNMMQHFQKMMLDMQKNMFQAMVQQQKAALEYMRNELDERLAKDRHVNSPTSKYGDEREDNCLRTTGQTPSHVTICNGDKLSESSGVRNRAASTPRPSNAADPQQCLSFNQWVPSLVPPMPMSLPQADITEKFNGDLFDYPEFVQRFKTFIESQCTTDYQRLTCLRKYLGAESAELIRGCHMYADKTKAYRMAWERLNNTYGRAKDQMFERQS